MPEVPLPCLPDRFRVEDDPRGPANSVHAGKRRHDGSEHGDLTRQSVVGADISQASDGDIRTTRQRQSGRRHENRAAGICARVRRSRQSDLPRSAGPGLPWGTSRFRNPATRRRSSTPTTVFSAADTNPARLQSIPSTTRNGQVTHSRAPLADCSRTGG